MAVASNQTDEWPFVEVYYDIEYWHLALEKWTKCSTNHEFLKFAEREARRYSALNFGSQIRVVEVTRETRMSSAFDSREALANAES